MWAPCAGLHDAVNGRLGLGDGGMNVSSPRDGVTVRTQRSDRLAQRASSSALPVRRAAPNPAPRGRQAAQTLLDGAGRELLARETGNLGLLVVGAGAWLCAALPGFQL